MSRFNPTKWIDQTLERIAIHLERDNFDAARMVLNDVELSRSTGVDFEALSTPIASLDLPVVLVNLLEEYHDAIYVGDLVKLTEYAVLQTPNIRGVLLGKLKKGLAEIGVEWPSKKPRNQDSS